MLLTLAGLEQLNKPDARKFSWEFAGALPVFQYLLSSQTLARLTLWQSLVVKGVFFINRIYAFSNLTAFIRR